MNLVATTMAQPKALRRNDTVATEHIAAIVRSANDEVRFYDWGSMSMSIRRRDFLKTSASLGGLALAGGFSCAAVGAGSITPPVVDKLSVDIIVDLTHNLFLKPAVVNGVAVQPAP